MYISWLMKPDTFAYLALARYEKSAWKACLRVVLLSAQLINLETGIVDAYSGGIINCNHCPTLLSGL